MSGLPDLRIKLRYNPIVPGSNFAITHSASPAMYNGADITIAPWDFTIGSKYVRVGQKTIEELPHVFYENRRTDFLQQTEVRPTFIDDTTSIESAVIHFTGPTVSLGTTIPPIASGVDIVKYEEQLAAYSATPSSPQVVSEQLGILKTQKRDALRNSYSRDFTYYEDVHYVDPNQQRHSNLEEQWPQWLDIDDFANEQEAFVQHLTNVFDYRYTPVRLLPEAPMSGRIDVLDHIRSFYDNMPEAVLTNTKKTISAQSFELDSVTIMKSKYLKKSEEIDVKKFEDVIGKRDEGHNGYHIVEIVSPQLGITGIVRSINFQYQNLQLSLTFRDLGGNPFSLYWDIPAPDTPPLLGDKNITGYAFYHGYVPPYYPVTIVNDDIHDPETVDRVMILDYFDQIEPDVLDYVEEEPWSRIDDEMMVWLTKKYYDHDDNPFTAELATGRSIEIDRRKYQQDAYLYANTGHTTVHYEQVNGIIAPEWKR